MLVSQASFLQFQTIEGLNHFTAPLNEKISVLEKRAQEAAANFGEAAMNLGD